MVAGLPTETDEIKEHEGTGAAAGREEGADEEAVRAGGANEKTVLICDRLRTGADGSIETVEMGDKGAAGTAAGTGASSMLHCTPASTPCQARVWQEACLVGEEAAATDGAAAVRSDSSSGAVQSQAKARKRRPSKGMPRYQTQASSAGTSTCLSKGRTISASGVVVVMGAGAGPACGCGS